MNFQSGALPKSSLQGRKLLSTLETLPLLDKKALESLLSAELRDAQCVLDLVELTRHQLKLTERMFV